MYDYSDREGLTTFNQVLNYMSSAFTIVFVIEAIIKIIAMGFIGHQHAYLRDAWNILDFAIAITGAIELITTYALTKKTKINLKALRNLRVLRPLRTVNAIPSMRRLVATLIGSLNQLMNVAIFIAFLFLLFGVLGLQLFQGTMYNACRLTPEPFPNSTWPKADDGRLCSIYSNGGRKCPESQICGNPEQYGLTSEQDGAHTNLGINQGVASFDDFFQSILAVFQIISKDSWSTILLNLMDVTYKPLATLYTAIIILLGAFFSINLILAVIIQAFKFIQKNEELIEEQHMAKKESYFKKQQALMFLQRLQKRSQDQQSQQVQNEENQDKNDHKEEIIEKGKQLNDQDNKKDSNQQLASLLQQIGKMKSENEKQSKNEHQNNDNSDTNSMIQFEEIDENKDFTHGFITYYNRATPGSLVNKSSFVLQKLLSGEDEGSTTNCQPLSRILAKTKLSQNEMEPKISFSQFPQIEVAPSSIRNMIENTFKKQNQEIEKETDRIDFYQDFINSKRMLGGKKRRHTVERSQQLSLRNLLRSTHDANNMFENREKIDEEIMKEVDQEQRLEINSLSDSQSNSSRRSSQRQENADVSPANRNQTGKVSLGAKIFQGVFKPLDTQEEEKQQYQNDKEETNKIIIALKKKFLSTLDIKDPKERILRQKTLKIENNFLLFRLQRAMKKKFEESKQSYYGLQNESNILNLLQSNIRKKVENNAGIELRKFRTTPQVLFNDRSQREKLALDLHQQIKEQHIRKLIFDRMAARFKEVLYNKSAIEHAMIEAQQTMTSMKLQKRAEKRLIFKVFLQFIEHKYFQIFINLCIVANTIVLAQDKFSNSQDVTDILDKINLSFYSVFVFEMISKLIGMGIMEYFRDKFNAFDFLIVIISSIDVALTQSNMIKVKGTSALQALRAFRLLRVFKLAKSWRQFQNLLKIIGETIQDISTFSILLLVFIFTYTLMGMEWFAFKLKINDDQELDMINGFYPDPNFNTFIQAFLVVFDVLTGDTWAPKYYQFYRAISGPLSSFFFLSLTIVGQYILLMLFLAILVENFDEESINQFQDQQRKQKSNLKRTFKMLKNTCLKKICLKIREKDQENLTVSMYSQNMTTTEQSMNTSQNANSLKGVAKFVSDKRFEYTILGLILISSIQLALDNPLNDPNGMMTKALRIVDIILTCIFIIEVILKMIGFGVLLNGPNSYLRNYWNIIDLTIIVLSIISASTPNIDLSVFKVLRMFRVLRPLRISIMALFQAIPNILNVLLIAGLFFLIFSIIGINFMKGLFYECDTSLSSSLPFLDFDKLETKWDCLNAGGDWTKSISSFDDVLYALIEIFLISQTFSWSITMFRATTLKGIDMIPKYKGNIYYSLFFVFFVIIGNFFITNLFVGVVVSTYNREKEKLGKYFLLTEDQKKWLKTKLLVIQARPKFFLKLPQQKIRVPIYNLLRHRFFERFIMGCIVTNTFVLMLSWYQQPKLMADIIDYINFTFTLIFVIESLLKITAFTKRYFQDYWNIFDFIIAFGSLVGLILQLTSGVNGVSATTAIRSFRLLKLFQLFRKQKSLRIIFETFIVTLPALANVGGLLLLLMYIFSILCMNIFAEVLISDGLTPNLNFQQIGNSLITLFVMSTGDSFYEIQKSVSRSRTIEYDCIVNPSYYDYKENGHETLGCGNIHAAVAIFFFFILVVILIFLNLFIAIIIQGYNDTIERNTKLFNSDVKEQFREVWSQFDQDAEGYIKVEDFPFFMIMLGKPLGWDPQMVNDDEQQKLYIQRMDFPTYNNFKQYSFIDVIENLVMLQVVQIELQKYLEEQKQLALDGKSQQEQGAPQDQETMRETLKNRFKEAEEKEDVEIVKAIKKQSNPDYKRRSMMMDAAITEEERHRRLDEILKKTRSRQSAGSPGNIIIEENKEDSSSSGEEYDIYNPPESPGIRNEDESPDTDQQLLLFRKKNTEEIKSFIEQDKDIFMTPGRFENERSLIIKQKSKIEQLDDPIQPQLSSVSRSQIYSLQNYNEEQKINSILIEEVKSDELNHRQQDDNNDDQLDFNRLITEIRLAQSVRLQNDSQLAIAEIKEEKSTIQDIADEIIPDIHIKIQFESENESRE